MEPMGRLEPHTLQPKQQQKYHRDPGSAGLEAYSKPRSLSCLKITLIPQVPTIYGTRAPRALGPYMVGIWRVRDNFSPKRPIAENKNSAQVTLQRDAAQKFCRPPETFQVRLWLRV